MDWFRSRSSLGSWLALFALAFQLAVSFGHVHLDRVVPANGSALSGVHATTNANVAAHRHGDKSPALTDDYCAICALIHLAGTVVAAAPPDLPTPLRFGGLGSEPRAEFELTAPNHTPFAARAPPIA
jgi:hypothetical protein